MAGDVGGPSGALELEVEMVLDRHQVARLEVRIEGSGGIGEDEPRTAVQLVLDGKLVEAGDKAEVPLLERAVGLGQRHLHGAAAAVVIGAAAVLRVADVAVCVLGVHRAVNAPATGDQSRGRAGRGRTRGGL